MKPIRPRRETGWRIGFFYVPRRMKWTSCSKHRRLLRKHRQLHTNVRWPSHGLVPMSGPRKWSIYWEAPLVYAISQVHAGIPADDLVSSSMQVPPATQGTQVRLSRPE